jgi:GDP-4-dehydro-6-deoxy-D-mannose reductase
VPAGRAFVTGASGFVGQHLVALLDGAVAPSHAELDLLNAEDVRRAVATAAPERVFHLAALASVARSWDEPRTVVRDNLAMTLNLLDAVREEAPDAAVVVAGSSEVYGPPERLPVTENDPLRPQSPYAVSKAACDLLAGQYADAYGLRVVRVRAFNQAGPGQTDEYVVGTIARQVAQAEADAAGEALIRTGNPDSARDFTDVRDTVRAYVSATDLPSGIYNVCSGHATRVRSLVELARRAARVEVRHEVDAQRVRRHDVPEVRGSAQRLAAATGWRPEIPLEVTVADAIAYWRERR